LATLARAARYGPLSWPNAARTQTGRRCSNPAPSSAPSAHPELEVQTGRGALGPKTVSPVCAGDWHQAAKRHLQSRTGRTSGNCRKWQTRQGKVRDRLGLLSEKSRRMPKRN